MADEAAYLDDYNGGALVGTAAAFLALTYLSVVLRTYVRAFMTNGFQADDWLMLVALASFTISCVFILIGVHNGVGRHNKALPQDEEIQGLKWQALATANYILNTLFVKLSIGVFLLRLSVQKRYTYTLWATMAIVTIWSLVLFFWDMFQCSPVRAQWDYTIPDSRCVSAQQIVNAAYALSVMTICSDWLFALLPIPMIWKVKMTTQTKMTVIVILGLGVFASVATLIRLKFLSDLTDTDDILFAGTDAMVWTLIEPGIAISAASFVVLRPLLRAWRVRGFESTDHASAGRSGHLRSGTRRSGRPRGSAGAMPGFGPADVTLVDMEARGGGGGGGRRSYHISGANGGAGADMFKGGGLPAGAVLDASFPSQATTLTSKASRTSGSEDDAAPVWGGGLAAAAAAGRSPSPAPPGSAKSDVFIIEGPPAPAHHHPRRRSWQRRSRLEDSPPPARWPAGRAASPSLASEEDLGALEAQSQHSGKVGLGGRS